MTGRRTIAMWVVSAVAAWVLAAGVATVLLPAPSWRALTAGWGLAVANAALARVLHRRAVGVPRLPFFFWGVAGNVLRVVAVLCILVAVISAHKAVRGAFVISVFTGIFVFLPAEIAELFRTQDEQKRTH